MENNFTVRKMEAADAALFRDYYLAQVWDQTPINMIDKQDPHGVEHWQKAISKYPIFGLFDRGTYIGFGMMTIKPDHVVFSGTHIHPSYRRQGFSHFFYEARKNYLMETGFKGRAITLIEEINQPSMKAAIRHGFRRVSDGAIEGKPHRDVTLEFMFK